MFLWMATSPWVNSRSPCGPDAGIPSGRCAVRPFRRGHDGLWCLYLSSLTDIRFVYASGGDPVGLGTFYFDGTENLRTVASLATLAGTATSGGTATTIVGTTQGSYICHRGQSSFGSANSIQSRGEVVSKAVFENATGTSISYTGGGLVAVRNTSTGKGTTIPATGTGTLQCYQGDSGGPWFAGSVAYGVTSACAWENGNTNSNRAILSVYTSLDYTSMAGATIVVP